MITYEQKLNQDLRWALREGSMHFERESAVHKTLQGITQRLTELGVPYAVVGGMALFIHGLRRFTEDVDILVNRDGLKIIHDNLEGRGYVPPFSGSKNLRDSDTGVRIEFLVTGDYPGDGKPKPIAFPDPANAKTDVQGISVLPLPKLVELKLASGLTNPMRGQDLVDVQRLIETLKLPAELCEQIDPSVRDEYARIWARVRDNPTPEA